MDLCKTAIFILFSFVVSVATASPPTADAIRGNSVYISTADNQWMLTLPMDSPVAVESAFEVLSKDYNVDRIWWRGGQDELWFQSYTFRKSNRFFYELWEWIRHLVEDRGTNRAAIDSARKHGMQIWMETGLFEFGTQEDAGVYPYSFEDSLRIDHPDWIPVNKYGTRRQGGPIEFAYPEARRIYIERMANFLRDQKYDGVIFYTYVENCTMRYFDEFGYNDPIVDEFRNRHGVDIRKESFDKQAWAKLRGEYVTQFFRELHAALAPHGIQVAVRITPVEDSHLPEIWASATEGKVRTAGNIHLDWETWAKEGTVDELCIFWPGNDDILNQVRNGVKGTDTRISMYRTQGDMPDGVIRCISPGEEVSSGFARENFPGWDNEQLPPQSLDAFISGDKFARRRVLYMIMRGKQPDANQSFEAVAKAATDDPDLYVRQLAVDALVVLGDSRAIPVLERALKDPENSVRCKAALALGTLKATQSIDLIFEAVSETSTLQFTHIAAKQTISSFAATDPAPVIQRIVDDDVNVRRLAVQCLADRDTPDTRAALFKAAADDPDAYVRELAIATIATFRPDEQTTGAVMRSLVDPDEVVQVRAATYIATCIPQASPPPGESPLASTQWRLDQPIRFELFAPDTEPGKLQRDALQRLIELFKSYNDDETRNDARWGWRAVGNSILCFGDEGEAELKKLMTSASDRKVAENAWQVVYIRQQPMRYCLVSEQQDADAHSHHPFLKK